MANGPPATTLTLDRLGTGSRARVVVVAPQRRVELASEGILPGAVVSIASVAPLRGPLVLRVGRARVALARAVAAGITVTPEAVGEAEP